MSARPLPPRVPVPLSTLPSSVVRASLAAVTEPSHPQRHGHHNATSPGVEIVPPTIAVCVANSVHHHTDNVAPDPSMPPLLRHQALDVPPPLSLWLPRRQHGVGPSSPPSFVGNRWIQPHVPQVSAKATEISTGALSQRALLTAHRCHHRHSPPPLEPLSSGTASPPPSV